MDSSRAGARPFAGDRVFRRLRESVSPLSALSVASVLTVVGLYWGISVWSGTNQALVPPPPTIFSTLVEQLTSGSLLANTLASLQRVALGFALGGALAVLIGCTAGWYPIAGAILNPLINAIRPIPALAYIPLFIVWIGIDETTRILVLIFATFKPAVVNARAGMQQVPQIYVDAAETLGATQTQIFLTVALPNAIPYIVAGLRTALSTCFLALVAAELVAADSGLGFMIQSGAQYFRTDVIFVGILAIAVVAVALDWIAASAGDYLTRWAEVRK
jgi:ABC-type nitrate/sulfonate/bicarbonate transport system permease component